MDFNRKFIRYHPNITLEIFQLIWNKLYEIGWSVYCNQTITRLYKDFEKEKFLESSSETNKFSVYSKNTRSISYTEITIEEFLEYNPFTKSNDIDWSKPSIKEAFDLQEQNNLKPEPEFKQYPLCVHCKTQEEVNFVLLKHFINITDPTHIKIHGEVGLYVKEGVYKGFDKIDSAKNKVDKVVSFEQWDKDNNFKSSNSEFKKGDYIVTLKGDFNLSVCAKENYCFKQRSDNTYISPTKDLSGVRSNRNTEITFDKSKKLTDWRYATVEEIQHYDAIEKPYDVTTLNQTIKTDFVPGKWYKGKYTDGYIKFSHAKKMSDYNRIYYSEQIYNNIHKVINDYWASNAFEKFALTNPVNLEEIQSFLPKDHPDKFVKLSLKQGVHCKIQEEWDFILSKFNPRKLTKTMFSEYPYLFIVTKHPEESHIGCCGYIDENYQIISFEDWCKQNNYVMETKSQFEVGKWYKSNMGNTFPKYYYLKVSSISEDRVFGERISNDGRYEKNEYWDDYATLKDALKNGPLSDLSEIQKFLPDGHPDKGVDASDLSGRWIKCLETHAYGTNCEIGKFYQLLKQVKEEPDKYTIIKEYNLCIRIKDKEYWELMPVGFKPPKEEYPYKPGDWIITKGYCLEYDGKPLYLTKIDAQGYCYFDNTDDKQDNCHLRRITRLATPEEIQSVQVKQSIESSAFILPERWYIKFHEKVGEWLNEKTNQNFYHTSTFKYFYYPDKNSSHLFNVIDNGYTEITLDQFERYVLKEEKLSLPSTLTIIDLDSNQASQFTLPEKWYCLYKDEEEFKVMRKFFKTEWYYCTPNEINGCTNIPECNNWNNKIHKDSVLITFEQFKKYVVKEKDSNMTATGVIIDLSTPEDALIDEAKRRYPLGTKFYPAHIKDHNQFCIITSDTVFEINSGKNIYANIPEGRWSVNNNPNYGNTAYNRCILIKGIWADIKELGNNSEALPEDFIPVDVESTNKKEVTALLYL